MKFSHHLPTDTTRGKFVGDNPIFSAADSTQWGNKKYRNMKHLEAAIEDASIAV